MNSIINVENVSKEYRIGADQTHDLRDTIIRTIRAPFDRLKLRARNGTRHETIKKTIWALKDINFKVEPGEVLGLIGSNGAGKSTLLKLLSRITEPTNGRIELYGHIGSLLEVGTGFHPELTGRENVLLNGAILGMKRSEIARKFDEIVAFSEIEKFIDTPVKYYSSGMYVRLAFSVAVHLEPEILLVDEVLSVGDMAFQQKCLQKVTQMRQQTKAIILVSHSMISVRAICSRAILLAEGSIVVDDTPANVISVFEKRMRELIEANLAEVDPTHLTGMGQIRIEAIRLFDDQACERDAFEIGEKVMVLIDYHALERLEGVVVYAAIRRPNDFICAGSSTQLENVTLPPLEGSGCIQIEIPELLVMPGDYVMDIIFYDHNIAHRRYFFGRKRVEFSVNTTLTGLDDFYGVFYQKQNWKVIEQSESASQN
jgi:lipopolysaccharide transport system ATP-binding protein